MIDTVEPAAPTPTATQVVAAIAAHAGLPARRVRRLLADDELARLVGALLGGADTGLHHDEVVGACLPRRAVTELLGGISRQAVAQRDGVDLLAVRQPGRRWLLYPVFQFDGARPLDGLADVLTVLGPHDPAGDGWAVAHWLRTPNALCGQRTPEQALREGAVAQVREAAAQEAATWGKR